MRNYLFAAAATAVVCGVTASPGARAADKCDPGAVAKKYPSLAGKTILLYAEQGFGDSATQQIGHLRHLRACIHCPGTN